MKPIYMMIIGILIFLTMSCQSGVDKARILLADAEKHPENFREALLLLSQDKGVSENEEIKLLLETAIFKYRDYKKTIIEDKYITHFPH